MNKLKSLYVAPFMTFMTVLGVWSLIALLNDGFSFGWAGAALIAVPFLIFLGGAMALKRTARTSQRLPVLIGFTLVGTMLAIFGLIEGEAAPPAIMALIGGIGFLIYDFWYSQLGRTPSDAIAVGNKLPDFEVQDEAGITVRAADFIGAPAVFLFFRGNWCPLCMAQIKEVAGRYDELAQLGASVCLVSPQSHAQTQKLAAKFDVPFRFLVDVGNQAAKTLKIDHIAGLPKGMEALGYDSDTVLPTVIVTDKDGTILFADQTDNYRVRPEPDTFISILKEAGAVT